LINVDRKNPLLTLTKKKDSINDDLITSSADIVQNNSRRNRPKNAPTEVGQKTLAAIVPKIILNLKIQTNIEFISK